MADGRIRIGMPASLWLQQFGSYVWDAFGEHPYLVGSALKGERPAFDVDVRLILDDAEWDRLELGHPDRTHMNARWVALCMAWSAFGRAFTQLPIDFQIQPLTWANDLFANEPRSALGIVPHRITQPLDKNEATT